MSQQSRYYCKQSSFSASQNKALESAYMAIKDSSESVKTHYLGGRFENIYIDRGRIPSLAELLDEAIQYASQILDTYKNSDLKLKVGFWFNEMQAGHKTSAHTHDEDDELLSGVYYINVPESSGNLVLGDTTKESDECVSITPIAGEFIFFSPRLLHAVDENESGQMRLSIGMNFGSV